MKKNSSEKTSGVIYLLPSTEGNIYDQINGFGTGKM